jgi:fluoroquinolone transport system permease protein
LIIACKTITLNQFVLATIPAEILINIPAVIWLFWYKENWLLFHPGVGLMILCDGSGKVLPILLILLLWTSLFTFIACKTVHKMLKSVGGIKL